MNRPSHAHTEGFMRSSGRCHWHVFSIAGSEIHSSGSTWELGATTSEIEAYLQKTEDEGKSDTQYEGISEAIGRHPTLRSRQ